MCFNEITYQKANATVKNLVRDHPNELVFLKRYLAENAKVMQCLYVTLYPKYYSRNNKFDMQNKSLVDLTYWEWVFFSMWVFFHEHSRITGLQGKGEGISLTPHYHFHPLNRYLDISRAITAESSPLHIASSQTRTGNLWFPSASR